MGYQDLEPSVGCHRSRGIPADEQAVPRVTRSHPSVVAEHLTGHTELKWGEAVVDDNRNIAQGTLRRACGALRKNGPHRYGVRDWQLCRALDQSCHFRRPMSGPTMAVVTTAGFFRAIGHDRTADKRRIARPRNARPGDGHASSRKGHGRDRRRCSSSTVTTFSNSPLDAIEDGSAWLPNLPASSLDHKLAQGPLTGVRPAPSRSSSSARLASSRSRTHRGLGEPVGTSSSATRHARCAASPCNRESIIACESDIREMLNALLGRPDSAPRTAARRWRAGFSATARDRFTTAVSRRTWVSP